MPDKDTLEQLLKFLLETFQQSKDFTLEQAPQVVHEFLSWYFYESLFFMCVGFGILLLAYLVFRIVRTAVKGTGNDGAEWIPAGFGGLVGWGFVLHNGYNMLKVTVAPRVVLIEMIKNLLN